MTCKSVHSAALVLCVSASRTFCVVQHEDCAGSLTCATCLTPCPPYFLSDADVLHELAVGDVCIWKSHSGHQGNRDLCFGVRLLAAKYSFAVRFSSGFGDRHAGCLTTYSVGRLIPLLFSPFQPPQCSFSPTRATMVPQRSTSALSTTLGGEARGRGGPPHPSFG
jgi:hypothetical protein